MSKDVFERVEKKYRINSVQRQALEGILHERGYDVDCYGKSTITSMYWDTDDHSLICRSLENPLYKEKVRIRSYTPEAFCSADEDVFVELKKKFDGVVYKRRVERPLNEAYRMLSGATAVRKNNLPSTFDKPTLFEDETQKTTESVNTSTQNTSEVMNEAEVACFVGRYPVLSPSITTRCIREAWALTPAYEPDLYEQDAVRAHSHDPDLRVTFDSCLMGCDERNKQDEHYRRDQPSEWFPLTGEDESILEAKAKEAFPFWFAHALSELGIRPCSFSKCGTAFLKVAERDNAPV